MTTTVISVHDFHAWWNTAAEKDDVPTLYAHAIQNALCSDAFVKGSVNGPFEECLHILINKLFTSNIELLAECVCKSIVPDALSVLCHWFNAEFQRPLVEDETALYLLSVLWDEKDLADALFHAATAPDGSKIIMTETKADMAQCAGKEDAKMAAQLIRGPLTKYASEVQCNMALRVQEKVVLVSLKINEIVGEEGMYVAGLLSDAHTWATSMAGGNTPVVLVVSFPKSLTPVHVERIRDALQSYHATIDCCTRLMEWLNNAGRSPLHIRNHNSGHIMQLKGAETMAVVSTGDTISALSVDVVYSESGASRRGMSIAVESEEYGMRSPLGSIREQ